MQMHSKVQGFEKKNKKKPHIFFYISVKVGEIKN